MRLKLRELGKRGDTIVEVLVVVAVLGFVIMISYSVATRTQRTNRQTEEHTQAIKIAEGQLEKLRSYNTAIIGTNFCFNQNGDLVTLPGGVQAPDYTQEDFSLYPDDCKLPPVGGNCASYCYYVSVNKGNDGLYTVAVRWDGPTGRRDQVILQYRMSA